ncbi:MAG: hypothetical protein ABR526_12390 [Chthoniobacterales bacterium]
MPVSLILQPEERITITVLEGVITDAELIAARQQVLTDPAFDPSNDRVWDFYSATHNQVSEAVAAQMVAESPIPGKPICRAVVISAATEGLPAILGFIDSNRAIGRRIAAFPIRAAAVEWIKAARHDLPPE